MRSVVGTRLGTGHDGSGVAIWAASYRLGELGQVQNMGLPKHADVAGAWLNRSECW